MAGRSGEVTGYSAATNATLSHPLALELLLVSSGCQVIDDGDDDNMLIGQVPCYTIWTQLLQGPGGGECYHAKCFCHSWDTVEALINIKCSGLFCFVVF